MLSALLLFLVPTSSYFDPGAGWKFYEGIKDKNSVSTRITSDDVQSILVVRCDTVAGPVLSMQYVPAEDVGISMSNVGFSFSKKDGNIIDYDIIWELHTRGIYIREAEDETRVESIISYFSDNEGKITISTKTRYGDPIRQEFTNIVGRENLQKVIQYCLKAESVKK